MNGRENVVIFENLKLPDWLEIKKNKYGYGLFSLAKFQIGDIVYKYQEHQFFTDSDKITIRMYDGYKNFDTLTHINLTNDKMAFQFFDTFRNHSCDPNVFVYDNIDNIENYTEAKAVKNIDIGDEITSDYGLCAYEVQYYSIQDCKCESAICRKNIEGFKDMSINCQLKLLPYVEIIN